MTATRDSDDADARTAIGVTTRTAPMRIEGSTYAFELTDEGNIRIVVQTCMCCGRVRYHTLLRLCGAPTEDGPCYYAADGRNHDERCKTHTKPKRR